MWPPVLFQSATCFDVKSICRTVFKCVWRKAMVVFQHLISKISLKSAWAWNSNITRNRRTDGSTEMSKWCSIIRPCHIIVEIENQEEITLEQWFEELRQDEKLAPLYNSLYTFFLLLHQRSIELKDQVEEEPFMVTLYRIFKWGFTIIVELPLLL